MNTGSYFRILFSGKQVNLTFDVSQMVDITSEIYFRVDNGPMTPSLVLSNVYIPVSSNLSQGDVPFHYLEVMVKSMTETRNRWSNGISTRVVFTGLLLDNGSEVTNVVPKAVNILIYGDSITEGVLCAGGSQKFDTDHNDVSLRFPSPQSELFFLTLAHPPFFFTA